jgi:hypothetical protein
MASGLAPWHMWGNSQVVHLIGDANTQTNALTQLVKVAYGRPESFNFLFAATLIAVEPNVAPTGINIYFDVTTGVGRSSTTMMAFETYQFSWLAGAAIVPRQYRTASVIVPYRSAWSSAADPYPDAPNIIDHLVAQDLQVQVRSTMAPAIGETVDIEVAAYFSPIAHVRPEWHRREYPGNEDNGH